MVAQTAQNGAVNRLLDEEPMSAGYRPTLPMWTFWQPDGTPILFILRDIELMLTHPVVYQGLEYYKSGIAGAEFDAQCDNSAAGEFILDQCQRFWDRGVPKAQNGGYPWGWLGGENVYSTDEGPIKWDCLLDFAPRDTYLLTEKGKPIGVRVKSVQGKGAVNLWLNADPLPSKGFWYEHRPQFQQYYGRSQFMGAWKPWKRLAWKDGLESVIDAGLYRFAYAGPSIRYPPEDLQAQFGSPATTLDSQGRPRRYAREVARQMGEQLRAGAAVAMSSEHYPTDQGGHPKWEVEWPDHVLSVDPLINAAKYLQDQIYFGIGVPPELIQASETGSGYSGRQIPMEAFLMQQQHLADAMLDCFLNQVLRPLVAWNFGKVKFEVKVKPLLQTKTKMRQGMSGETRPNTQEMPQPGMHNQPHQPMQRQLSRVPVIPMSLLMDNEKDIVRRIIRGARAA